MSYLLLPQRARVVLTDAQVKALPTTPIALVAAPGSGYVLHPTTVTMRSSFAAGAYTNVNAAAWMSAVLGSSQDIMSSIANDASITNAAAGTTMLTSFLGVTPRRVTLVPRQHTENVNEWGELAPIAFAVSAVDNVGLNLIIDNNGGGALTGGNAANTLTVIVTYLVEPI